MDVKARIPVDADAKVAKSKMGQLHQDRKRTRRRMTTAARRTQRMAVRAFAFTGAAATFSKFQNDEPAAKADVFGEALVPYYALAQQTADRELGFSGKARQSAREETKAAFAYHVGQTGETVGMREFFNTVSRIREDVETGRNLIRQDPRFIGPDLGDVSKAALKGNIALFLQNLKVSQPMYLLERGFDYIVEGITAD